jgi:hypothetical protein
MSMAPYETVSRADLSFELASAGDALKAIMLVFRSKRAQAGASGATRLNVVHPHPIIGGRARAHVGKRAAIEHIRNGVAGVDHDQADRAGFEIAAIVAGPESGDRSAWDWGQRTVEDAHDCADWYLMRQPREGVSPALPLLRVDEAGVPEFGQDMIEKLFRNRIGFGDVRDLSQLARFKSRQVDHRLEAVLPLLREHDSILTLERRGRCYADRTPGERIIANSLPT